VSLSLLSFQLALPNEVQRIRLGSRQIKDSKLLLLTTCEEVGSGGGGGRGGRGESDGSDNVVVSEGVERSAGEGVPDFAAGWRNGKEK